MASIIARIGTAARSSKLLLSTHLIYTCSSFRHSFKFGYLNLLAFVPFDRISIDCKEHEYILQYIIFSTALNILLDLLLRYLEDTQPATHIWSRISEAHTDNVTLSLVVQFLCMLNMHMWHFLTILI